METNLDNTPQETRTAKEYYREHRDRVMVIPPRDGRPLDSRDFFVVESVGTIEGGLLITGLFDHARRERMHSHQVRLATLPEIASRDGACTPGGIAL